MYICMYYNPNWFIPSTFLLSTLVILWYFSTCLKILYSQQKLLKIKEKTQLHLPKSMADKFLHTTPRYLAFWGMVQRPLVWSVLQCKVKNHVCDIGDKEALVSVAFLSSLPASRWASKSCLQGAWEIHSLPMALDFTPDKFQQSFFLLDLWSKSMSKSLPKQFATNMLGFPSILRSFRNMHLRFSSLMNVFNQDLGQ
jgi:hypothetical protein